MNPTREDLELYVMGAYDGDVAELERAIASDRSVADAVVREAELELLLREAAAQATFCPSCRDLVQERADDEPARCDACGAAVRPGGYVVEKVLVSNAHGRMYVARDADGKRVALKELAFVQSPSPAAVAAFEREAVLLRALDHPRIPRFCASFEEGRGIHVRYYLAQELVEGASLDARLADHFYAEPEIVDLARQVLEVLVYLQGLSPIVIHRDLKPANLITRANGQVAVVDFGAAHIQGTTAGSTTIGTFGYMPIEQLAGIVDATTDTYALGATLLHLLTRREPWRFLQGTVDLANINVSPPLRTFLARLVAPEPRERFPSAAAALAALDDAVAGKAIVVAARAPAPRPPRLKGPRIYQVLGMAAAAVALIGLGVIGHALVRSMFTKASDPAPRAYEAPVATPPPPPPQARSERLMKLYATACSCDNLTCIESVARELQHFTEAPERTDIPLLEGIGKCLSKAGKKVSKAVLAPAPALPSGERTDLDFTNAPLHDVLRTLAESCKIGLVVPDHVDAKINVRLKRVPCDQAFEVVLEANGMWYAYEPAGNLVRVGVRKELAKQRAQELRKKRDPLPDGDPISLDFKDAPLRDVVTLLAAAGKTNIVVPPHVDGKVTIRVKEAPWRVVFEAILDAQHLGYRYRPSANVVRVGVRKELEEEDDD